MVKMKRTIAAILLATTMALVPTRAIAQSPIGYATEVYWRIDLYVWLLFWSEYLETWYEVTNGSQPSCLVWPYYCDINAYRYCSYVYFDDGSIQGECAGL